MFKKISNLCFRQSFRAHMQNLMFEDTEPEEDFATLLNSYLPDNASYENDKYNDNPQHLKINKIPTEQYSDVITGKSMAEEQKMIKISELPEGTILYYPLYYSQNKITGRKDSEKRTSAKCPDFFHNRDGYVCLAEITTAPYDQEFDIKIKEKYRRSCGLAAESTLRCARIQYVNKNVLIPYEDIKAI